MTTDGRPTCRSRHNHWPTIAGLLLATALTAFSTSSHAVSIQFDGTSTLLSGTDCQAGAQYQLGTTASYKGTALDMIVEITGDDNDYVSGNISVNGTNRFYECFGLISDDPGDPELLSVVGIDGPDNGDSQEPWSTDLKFQLVAKGSTTPVTVDRILMTAFDLDIKPGNTGADNILLANPGAVYLDRNTEATHAKINIAGPGGTTYTDQLRGTSLKDCTPETDPACRGAAIWTNVSEFSFRALNNKSGAAPRLFQFSFEVSYFREMALGEDRGDAPVSYGEGASTIDIDHLLGAGLAPDNDAASLASGDAQGDDSDAATSRDFDDDEAVSYHGNDFQGQTLYLGRTHTLDISAFGSNKLSAFFDWNNDGDFGDSGEKVIDDRDITTGKTPVEIRVPDDAVVSANSFARFRVCADADSCNTASGSSGSGETEDYQFEIRSGDSDQDGIADNIDIDDDNDGILDTAEGDGQVDTDGDGVPDSRDIDSDNDGLLDNLEAQSSTTITSRSSGPNVDADLDGWFDRYNSKLGGSSLPLPDTDNDGTPDYCDLDSDHDGIRDITENNGTDSNHDGRVDAWSDSDGDGIPDNIDIDSTQGNDSDGDGIDDKADAAFAANAGLPDSDGDGIVDSYDLDANGDGFIDVLGDFATRVIDQDSNGTPDFRETAEINTGLNGAGGGLGSFGWLLLLTLPVALRRKNKSISRQAS